MNPDRDPRWQEIDTLLDRLFDAEPEMRDAILREVAAEDPDLARDARRLIAAAEKIDLSPGGGLATGLLRGIEPSASMPDSALGERIGPWRPVGELGHGGMGRVYLAERADGQFEQRVALKLLFAGPRSDDLVRRFDQERRILARLDHPNIARLLDGGVTEDGRPWFAMELVDGVRIDHYCDRHRLGVDERLRLSCTVAAAVQAAHRSLIIHRDLKPANVLVTREGEVKLLDFGIAKPLDGDAQTADATRTLQRMLTPSYATPEQIRGESLTTASDVYQLGLLLFELLTGRRAHRLEETTPQAIERAVCESTPTRPSLAVLESVEPGEGGADAETLAAIRSSTPARLARRLRGDLDTIVLTALRKEPERRYASAEQMASDVRRHLEAQPVQARPDSLIYRTSKFIQRHAAGVATATVVLVVVATLVAFYTARLQRERDRAQAEAAKAEQVAEFLADVFRSSDPRRAAGEEPTVRAALDRGAEKISTDLAEQPVVQAELMNVLGRIHLEMGDFERAEGLLASALELRREYDDPPETAESLRNLGLLRYEQADYARAEKHYAEAVELLEATRGGDAPQLAAVLNNLGLLYRRTGELEKGVAAYERALAIHEAHLGPTAEEVGKVANNLGNILLAMGEDRRAVDAYERALAIHESNGGRDNPLAGGTLGNIGLVRLRLGEYEGLEEIFRRELAIFRASYGPVHTNVANSLTHLGSLFAATGRFDEAVESYRRATEVYRRSLGADHPYVAHPLHKLGDLYLNESRPVEAAEYFRQAASLREAALGPEHPLVASCLEGLGRALSDAEDLAESESVLRRAVAIRRLSQQEDPESLGAGLGFLGGVLVKQQRCTEALPMLREAKGLLGADKETSGDELAEVAGLIATCARATA